MFLSEWCEFPSAPCLAEKKDLMTAARVSMLLQSRASLTCFRACVLPSRAKDLSAPWYVRFGDVIQYWVHFFQRPQLRCIRRPHYLFRFVEDLGLNGMVPLCPHVSQLLGLPHDPQLQTVLPNIGYCKSVV